MSDFVQIVQPPPPGRPEVLYGWPLKLSLYRREIYYEFLIFLPIFSRSRFVHAFFYKNSAFFRVPRYS